MLDQSEIQFYVNQARDGDREAFGFLVNEFESMVFGIVLARLRNRSEAREVSQDVFLQAMRKLPQLREPERFVGWLRQIAVRMSINRAVRRPNESACAPENFASLNDAGQLGPLSTLLDREAAGQVRDGLDRLGTIDRETLIAFYFEGRSLKEMACDFERPIGTIKRRLHTARNRLRDELVSMQPA